MNVETNTQTHTSMDQAWDSSVEESQAAKILASLTMEEVSSASASSSMVQAWEAVEGGLLSVREEAEEAQAWTSDQDQALAEIQAAMAQAWTSAYSMAQANGGLAKEAKVLAAWAMARAAQEWANRILTSPVSEELKRDSVPDGWTVQEWDMTEGLKGY